MARSDFSPLLNRIQVKFDITKVSKREINDYFQTFKHPKNEFIAENVYGYALSKQINEKINKINTPSQYEDVEEELNEADNLASESDFRSPFNEAQSSFKERREEITEGLKIAKERKEAEKVELFAERGLSLSRENILQGSKRTVKSYADFYGIEERDVIDLVENRGLFVRDGRIVEEI